MSDKTKHQQPEQAERSEGQVHDLSIDAATQQPGGDVKDPAAGVKGGKVTMTDLLVS